MELYMVCVAIAISLGVLIYKGALFWMFISHPQPGEDLKWRQRPSLPMQELTRKFGSKGRDTGHRDHGQRVKGGTGHRTRPMPPIPVREKQPPQHFAPERVPLEIIDIEMEDEFDIGLTQQRPLRYQHYRRPDQDPYGTIV